MKKGKTIAKWGMGGVGIVVLAEIVLRIMGVAPPIPKVYRDRIYVPDPYLPYHQAPSISRRDLSTSGEFIETFTHNTKGFRDVEHAPEPPAGTVRVLGVGGSLTYGSAVVFEDSFLYLLEKQLNENPARGPIEIIKAGIGGFFPEAERLLVQHYGMAYEPDLLIVCFNETDIVETYGGIEDCRLHEGYLKTLEMQEVGHVGMFFVLHTHIGRILFGHRHKQRRRRLEKGLEKHLDEVWQKIGTEFDTMNQLMKGKGRRMILCHIPLFLPPPPETIAWLKAYEEQSGVIVVDCTSAFEAAAKEGPLYWKEDGHCNARGHKAVAAALFDAISERGLLERDE